MVVVADALDTRLDLFTVLGEALVLTTGRFERLLSLLQAHGSFGGRPGPRLSGASPMLCGSLCSRSSCSRAAVTALWAAALWWP